MERVLHFALFCGIICVTKLINHKKETVYMHLLSHAKVNRFRFTFACESKPVPVYAHRVVGRYRHHCHPCRYFTSSFEQGTSNCTQSYLFEQLKTKRNWLDAIF